AHERVRSIVRLAHPVSPSHDADPQEQGANISGKARAVRAVVHAVAAAVTLRDADRSVRGPEMTQQQRDLPVGQAESRRRNPFLMRALAEDARRAEPRVDACGMPTVSVTADQSLVPSQPPSVDLHVSLELAA